MHPVLTLSILFYLLLPLSTFCLLNSAALASNHSNHLSLSERIEKASLVVEATIHKQQTFVHPKDQQIYTKHYVKVHQLFKGDLSNAKSLSFTSIGGQFEDEITITCPSFQAFTNQTGVLLLQEKTDDAHINWETVTFNDGWLPYNVDQQTINYDHQVQQSIVDGFQPYLSHLCRQKPQQIDSRPYTNNTKSSSAIAVSSFSPQIVKAGVRQLLTINGSGFGSQKGLIAFQSPDTESEAFIPVSSNHISSWTDQQIKVYVPGSSGIGTGAATGKIYIKNTSDEYAISSNKLTILYNKVEIELQDVDLLAHNGAGGLTLQYSGDFAANTDATVAFERALNTWRCHSGFNIKIGNPTGNYCDEKEGINLISFSSSCSPISSGGITTLKFTLCGASGEVFLKEADIIFNVNANWQYNTSTPSTNQIDFESVALHELGHIFGLWHVLNTESIMHPIIIGGQTRRVIGQSSETCAALILAHSSSGTECGNTYPPGMDELNLTTPSVSVDVTDASCGLFNGAIETTVSGGQAPYVYSWNQLGSNSTNLLNINAGIYSLTVTSDNGCSTIKENIEVTASDGPSAIAFNTIDENCDQSNGVITPNVTGGTPPYTYRWADGNTSANLVNISAGTYTLIITDAQGCQLSDQISISNSSIENIESEQYEANCGQSNGAIVITKVNGGTPPFSYLWSNGSTNNTNNQLTVGNYIVTITDQNNCSFIKDFDLKGSNAINLEETIQAANCGESNGSISLVISGGSPPYTYQWNNPIINNDGGDNLPVGVYKVTITDQNDCHITDEFIIDGSSAMMANQTVANATCGENNGSISLHIVGGDGVYTYKWSNGATTVDLIDVKAGDYQVTIKDESGCQVIASETISDTPPIEASLAETNATCGLANGQIQVQIDSGTPPFSYKWSNGKIGVDKLNELEEGTYTVSITDQYACTTILSTTIDNTPSLAVDYTVEHTTCGANNGAITLIPSGGSPPFQYLWQNEITENETADQLKQGQYKATITDAVGCEKTVSINVENTDGPTALKLTTSPTICGLDNGSVNVIIEGGTPPYEYQWSNGQTDAEELDKLPMGDYELTITDANNCTLNKAFTINNTPSLTLNYEQTPDYCEAQNGTIELVVNNGNPPYQYQWDQDDLSGKQVDNLKAGQYTVTISDQDDCQIIQSFDIPVLKAPQASLSVENGLCGLANGSAQLSDIEANEEYAILWSNEMNGERVENLTEGDYSVSITDANDCQTVFDFTIAIGKTLSAEIEQQINPTCGTANGQIDVTITSGTPPYQYQWNQDGLPNSSKLEALAAGNYEVTITDANDCQTSLQVALNNAEAPTISSTAITASTCGLDNGIASIAITNGTPPYTIEWNAPNSPTTVTINELKAGEYTVKVTDSNDCTVSETITIPSIDPPILAIDVSATTCDGADGSAKANITAGTPPFTYTWSTNTQNTDELNNLAGGSYALTITDANNCSTNQTFDILQLNSPIIELGEDTTLVDMDSYILTIDASSDDMVLWSTGATTPNISITETGNYTVTITNQDGCSASDDILITFTTSPNTSTNTNLINNQWQVFPNPTVDDLQIQYTGIVKGQTANIYLYNLHGQLLLKERLLTSSQQTSTSLNLKALESGVYLVEIRFDNQQLLFKIIHH